MRMLTLTAALLLGVNARLAEAGPTRPNIVVILFDDLGSGDLGCQGAPTFRRRDAGHG